VAKLVGFHNFSNKHRPLNPPPNPTARADHRARPRPDPPVLRARSRLGHHAPGPVPHIRGEPPAWWGGRRVEAGGSCFGGIAALDSHRMIVIVARLNTHPPTHPPTHLTQHQMGLEGALQPQGSFTSSLGLEAPSVSGTYKAPTASVNVEGPSSSTTVEAANGAPDAAAAAKTAAAVGDAFKNAIGKAAAGAK